MKLNPKSIIKGFVMALAGLPCPVVTFCQYRYGSKVFAKPPADWDRETYPNAVIIKGSLMGVDLTLLYIMANPFTVDAASGKLILSEDTAYRVYGEGKSKWVYQDTTDSDGNDTEINADTLGLTIDTIIWSNYDIVDESGTVWLAGSDPVPVVGSNIVKSPVAYLYNGVRLPELPELNLEEYPYLVIRAYGTNYSILCSKNPSYFYVDSLLSVAYTPAPYLYSYIDSTGAWSDVQENTEGMSWTKLTTTPTAVWSNFDMKDTDGNVILAASVPVPVYE